MTSIYRNDPDFTRRLAVVERIKRLTGKLPAPIERALAVRAKVHSAAERFNTVDTTAGEAALIDEIASGKVPANLAERVAVLRARKEDAAYGSRLYAQGTERADHKFFTEIGTGADELLAVLRSALADTMAEVRKIGTPLVGLDLSDPLALPEPALVAYRRVRDLADRYQEIRATHAQLGRSTFGVGVNDGIGFDWLENAGDVWGAAIAARHTNATKPWPVGDPAALVMWLAGIAPIYHGAKPSAWLPTPSEQDHAFRELIKERQAS
jgi:hypothetical protein